MNEVLVVIIALAEFLSKFKINTLPTIKGINFNSHTCKGIINESCS